jgi:ribose transport system substrate-binding protein
MTGWASRTRRFMSAAAVVLVAIALGACGDDDDNSSGASSDQTAGQEQAGKQGPAEKIVAQYTKEQPPIELPPLEADPPKGKTLGIISCGLPVCQSVVKAAKTAASRLGWKTHEIQFEFAPESYIGAWNQMLEDPPDALLVEPLTPNATLKAQLAKVKELQIPMVGVAPAGDGPDDVMRAAYQGRTAFALGGKLMGAAVAADADEPETVFIWDPSLAPLWGPVKEEYTKQVEAAGGSIDVLEVQSAETGRSIPTQVVSYVQSHPDVKYLAFGLNDLTAGVAPALKSAGLAENVKIISRAPQPGNIKELETGDLWASVGEEDESLGWRAVDGLLRLMTDQELGECCTEPPGWHQIFTKDSLPPSGVARPPGSPEAFLEAWGLGG